MKTQRLNGGEVNSVAEYQHLITELSSYLRYVQLDETDEKIAAGSFLNVRLGHYHNSCNASGHVSS